MASRLLHWALDAASHGVPPFALSGPDPIDSAAAGVDASRMVTTLVRNSESALRPGSPAAGTRRFNATGTPPRVRAALRSGHYVVDADAVAAALLDRLEAGGSRW
jgi:hypothetical protein